MTFSVEQCSAIKQINRDEDKRILERAIKEKEMIEEEKQKAQKEREEALRSLIEEFKLQDTAVKAKRTQEEKDWKAWEMMQRFKRAEYDRQFNLGERKRQLQQKQEYRNELQRDIVSISFLFRILLENFFENLGVISGTSAHLQSWFSK